MKRSTAAWLALVVLACLLVSRADLFYSPIYEGFDDASNSLSILRAEHFEQLYGQYSRWGFYHPGPAIFYVQSWGLWLLWDCLHVCPAPHNAQVLAQLGLNVCLLVAALRVFTLWLPPGPGRWCFLTGALAFACFHFGGERGKIFLDTWPAFPPVLLMLVLLAAGAAVAAGAGGELPLLALAAGFLLHAHVAMPLFVFPLTALAYVGLLWHSRPAIELNPTLSPPQRLRRFLGVGWRAWPRAHLLSVGLLVIFAAPMVIDICHGADSNLAAIWHHLRSHRTEHRTWLVSVLYFLQFGIHTFYNPPPLEDPQDTLTGLMAYFGPYDHSKMSAYLHAHTLILLFWLGIAGTAAWAMIRQIPVFRDRRISSGAFGGTPAPLFASGRARPFLAWAGVFLVCEIALTLYWGRIQDGDMYYFNAYFNYAIYYFGALIAGGTLCAWPFAWSDSPRVRRAAAVACLIVGGGVITGEGVRIILARRQPLPTPFRGVLHQRISETVAATRAAGLVDPAIPRALAFVDDWFWSSAIGLEVRRAGWSLLVPADYQVPFGVENVWHPGRKNALRDGAQVWRLQPTPLPATASPVIPSVMLCVQPPVFLSVVAPVVDPAGVAGPAVLDYHPDGNAKIYNLFGWGEPQPWGIMSNNFHSMVAFVPTPVAGGNVELRVDASPVLVAARGLSSQRMGLRFNGELIGSEQRRDVTQADAGPLVFVIPAAVWNRGAARKQVCAVLGFDFPDAESPAQLDVTGRNPDIHPLGYAFRSLQFRAVPSSGGQSNASGSR